MQRAVGHAACEKSTIAAEVYRETGGRPFVASRFIARFLDAMHRELTIQGNPEISSGPVEGQRHRGAGRRRKRMNLFAAGGPQRHDFARRGREHLAVGREAQRLGGRGRGLPALELACPMRRIPQRDARRPGRRSRSSCACGCQAIASVPNKCSPIVST